MSAIAWLLVALGCRRHPRAAAAHPTDAHPLAHCHHLVATEDTLLSEPESPAEGIALATVRGGAIAAWLARDVDGRAQAILQRLDGTGRPTMPARVMTLLAPPPAAVVVPSVAVIRDQGWLVVWDDRNGCRAVVFDVETLTPRAEPVFLGMGACFAPALEPERGPTVVQSTEQGWVVRRITGTEPSPPILAPRGDRWVARARDGTTAFVADGQLWARRTFQGTPVVVTSVPQDVQWLALERSENGYVLAWSLGSPGGVFLQRLTAALEPQGEPKRYGTGGAGLDIAPVGPETWVVTADPTGPIGIVRIQKQKPTPSRSLEVMRPGTIRQVAVAGTEDGATIAYVADRAFGPMVHAFGVRCAAP